MPDRAGDRRRVLGLGRAPYAVAVTTPLRTACSHLMGWAMDRRLPRPWRGTVHRRFARILGADLSEVRPPLEAYPTLGAFFVRRLVDGARPFESDPDVLPAPCDGRLLTAETISDGQLLQAKGLAYRADELVGSLHLGGDGLDPLELEGARAFTIYLGPHDYHRIHCPLDARLERVRWLGGARFSVAPDVLARRGRVFVQNERAVLRLASARGPFLLVLVGALNVGRIRVVGVERGAAEPSRRDPHFARGEELARFEMGSTVIVIWPGPAPEPLPGLEPGATVRMGRPLARFA